MLVPADPQVTEGALVPVLDPGAGDHLRADEPGAVAPALSPEGLDADAGHRGQDDPGRHLHAADRPGIGQVHAHNLNNVPGPC